jgi:peptide-methionine (R)-S-oxide reductase
MAKITRTEDEWKKLLTPEQYGILRQKGTEPPFTGALNGYKGGGTFRCAACGAELFSGRDKFNAGCGWPSFTAPAARGSVEERRDSSHGMERTEVLCASCASHLGHVFPDGPEPGGLRYCINSAALKLDEKK